VKFDRPGVLLIGDTLNFGGTEGQFVEVACRLPRSRWDVQVTCVRAEGPLASRLESSGVKAWSCGPGSFKSPRLLSAIGRIVRYIHENRIRIVHCFDFYSNVLGVPAGRLARVGALIASQRDLGNLRPRPQRWIQRTLLGLADRILVNSPAIEESIAGTCPALSDRIELVANGVDLERYSPSREINDRPPHRWTIGTLANLRPEKGVDRFLQAARLVRERFPESRFIIWGEGPMRSTLERMSRELGLDGHTELRGRTVDAAASLRELDIFVLPSLSEASSNSLIEAMATGLPIVATRIGGTGIVVEDQVSGILIPADDPGALAGALVRLLEDRVLAATLGAAARRRACQEFGFDRMIARLEALYEKALGEACQ
jgi:glycosyltransferase involved in cell wall biosynthesis